VIEKVSVALPSKIQVGGLVYKVVYNPLLATISHIGLCRTEVQRIELVGDMSKQRELSVWIHELMHAINNAYLNSKLEESEIDSMAEGWHQVFTQLPVEFNVEVEHDS